MATITKREKTDGTYSFQVHIRVGGEKAIRSFDTEVGALEFIAQVEPKLIRQAKSLKRIAQRERAAAPLYADFLDTPMSEVMANYLSAASCTAHFKKSVGTILLNMTDVKVRSLTNAWSRSYIERMLKTLTPRKRPYAKSTIHDHFMAMRAAINYMANDLDVESPRFPYSAKDMLPKKDVQRDRRLELDEEVQIRQVFDKMAEPSRSFWNLLMSLTLETAARLQELILATWDEFDLQRRVWTIPAEHTKMKKERAIPLSIASMAILEKLSALRRQDSPRVFSQWASPNGACTGFHILVKRSGVKDFRFHDLRHEAASRMVLHKRKLKTFEIMHIVGHKDSKMLARYANLRADELVSRMD